MVSKLILISAIIAYVEARFGQENVPIAAISAVQGGASGAAATIAGATISDLLGGANSCAKLTRADQIVTELGGGADAIAAAMGLVAAEKNTNPFANGNVQNVCGDASLPATPELRGITPLIDPDVDVNGDAAALSAQTTGTPLNADGMSIFDLMAAAGLGDLVVAQGGAGGAAAGGAAPGGTAAGNANQGNANAGNANAGNANQGNATAGNATAGNDAAADQDAAADCADVADANAGDAAGNATGNAGADAGNANQNAGHANQNAGNAGNANQGNNANQNAGNANQGNANQGAANQNTGNANQNAGNAGQAGQNAGNAGNANNNAGNAAAGGAAAGGAVDFGSCTPTITFQGGEGNRPATEFTFQIADPFARGGQSEALNPNIITNALCNQLTNVCGADAAAVALCEDAAAQVEAAGTRNKSTADLFNSAVGFAGAVTNPAGGPDDVAAAARKMRRGLRA